MKSISRRDLEAMHDDVHRDFLLVNVLPKDTFNRLHIRTSVNVPVDNASFETMMEYVAGSKHREIVLYCASFNCPASTEAAEKLEKAGFTSVYDYEGGTQDWMRHKSAA
ncbi:MAG: rhodanese-like domain-containing protein [Ketobacter sp.]